MKIMLVCSDGGHYVQMQEILKAFDEHNLYWVTYDSPQTKNLRCFKLLKIGLNPLKMLCAAFMILFYMIKERPNVVVSTGAEIAIPALYLARFLGIYTIYVESWTRVTKLSFSGKMVYPIVHSFYVQWPDLLLNCGKKAKYRGGVL